MLLVLFLQPLKSFGVTFRALNSSFVQDLKKQANDNISCTPKRKLMVLLVLKELNATIDRGEILS